MHGYLRISLNDYAFQRRILQRLPCGKEGSLGGTHRSEKHHVEAYPYHNLEERYRRLGNGPPLSLLGKGEPRDYISSQHHARLPALGKRLRIDSNACAVQKIELVVAPVHALGRRKQEHGPYQLVEALPLHTLRHQPHAAVLHEVDAVRYYLCRTALRVLGPEPLRKPRKAPVLLVYRLRKVRIPGRVRSPESPQPACGLKYQLHEIRLLLFVAYDGSLLYVGRPALPVRRAPPSEYVRLYVRAQGGKAVVATALLRSFHALFRGAQIIPEAEPIH